MKTLKKALCLVLALVMVVGTLAISVSADDDDVTTSETSGDETSTAVAYDDLTDTAEITDDYELAVKILVALQIINGYNEDKTFRPQGTLTRQEAAKIICIVAEGIEGSKDYSDTTVSTGFTDVDNMSNKWAVGYIAYGVSEGILAGKGDNKFDPTGTLTGYEFEKMLLCAIGYDAEVEGLVGSSWKTRTTTVANVAEILDGMKNYSPAKNITREEAAQIAFNTLFAEEMSYSTTSTAVNNREYTGEWLINEVHDAITATDWAYLTSEERGTKQVKQGSKNIKTRVLTDLVDDNEFDGFGIPTGEMTLAGVEILNKAIPVYTWTKGSDVKFATTMKSVYGSLDDVEVLENGNKVDVTNTNTTKSVENADGTTTYLVVQTSKFVLGAYQDNKANWSKSTYTSWEKLVDYVTYAADCAGTYVEVYELNNVLYIAVKTATYAHVASAITSATTSDEVDSIAVSDLSDKTNNLSDTTRNTTVSEGDDLYAELKQNLDAYVGAYIKTDLDENGNTIYVLLDVDYLTAVAGSPSYYIPNIPNNGSDYTKYVGTLTFEGTTYQAAQEGDMTSIAGKTATEVAALAGSTLYVDANGAAYGIVGVTVSSGTKYAYVTKVSNTETSFGSGVYAAQIIKAEADAVPEVVNISVPATVTDPSTTYANHIVTYVVATDGTYSLTAQTTNFASYDEIAGTGDKKTNVTTKGSVDVATLAKKDGTEISTANYANNNTVFITITGTYNEGKNTGVSSSKVYKGISNVPTLLKVADGETDATNMYVAYLADSGTPTRLTVAVIINSQSDSGMAGIYFISVPSNGATKTTDLTGSYYTYYAVVDNAITTIKVNSDSEAYTMLEGPATEKVPNVYYTGFYKITSQNSDGQVLTFDPVPVDGEQVVYGQYKSFSGGVLTTVEGDDNVSANYVCAADVPVFVEKSTVVNSYSVRSGKIAPDTASNLNSSAMYVESWADDDNGTSTQSTGKHIYYFVDTDNNVTAVFIKFRSDEIDAGSSKLTGNNQKVTIDSSVSGVTVGYATGSVSGAVYQGSKVTLTVYTTTGSTVKIKYEYTDSWKQVQTKELTATESSDKDGKFTATFPMPAANVTITDLSATDKDGKEVSVTTPSEDGTDETEEPAEAETPESDDEGGSEEETN